MERSNDNEHDYQKMTLEIRRIAELLSPERGANIMATIDVPEIVERIEYLLIQDDGDGETVKQ